MYGRPLSACLFFCALVLTPWARAADAMSPAASVKSPSFFYLTLAPEAQLALIPPAPAKGSALDASDLATVLQVQANRTDAQITEAKNDQNYSVKLVSGMIAPTFTATRYPATFSLLNNVNHDVESLTGGLKNDYRRNRPYVNHPEVKRLFTAKDYSYPSGHASGSAALADTLALLFPDKKPALLARAQAIAQSRVTAGVHYPSDIQQGTALGDKLVALMLQNPAFQKDVAAAKAEIHSSPLAAVTASATTAASPQNTSAPK